MFAQAMTGFAKDSLLAVVSLYLSALLVFSGLSGLFAICGDGCADLLLLVGAILVSSLLVRLLALRDGMGESKNPQVTLMGILVASMVLLALHNSLGLFFGNEELILLCLTFFGILKAVTLAWDRYGHLLPGMTERVLVVGNGHLAHDMGALASSAGGRYELGGFVDLPMGRDVVTPLDIDVFKRAREVRADKIVLSLTEKRGTFPLQEMLNCKLSGIEVLDAPMFYERVLRKVMIETITPSFFIFSSGFKVTTLRRVIKRAADLVMASVGLLVAAPLMPFVFLAIKLDSPGPLIFRQIRVGEGDREFTIYKFRTMAQNAEKETGAVWSVSNDPRITRVGNFLRKSRIDEIPQLFNVLKGDMSMVGPRPERPVFVEELRKEIPFYSERHFVKPGITGWAQVCYPYGSSVEDAIEKLRYDLYYIKNFSLLFDLKIIWRTVGVVLLRKLGR